MNKLIGIGCLSLYVIVMFTFIYSDYKNKTIQTTIKVTEKYKVPYHGSDILVVVNNNHHMVIETEDIFNKLEINKTYVYSYTVNYFGITKNFKVMEVK